MTTDTDYPIYFSVDVETSALLPSEGELLSIGAVAVTASGHIIDTYYARIQRGGLLHESWYNEDLPAISDTQEFWRAQDQFVKDEAYMDRTLERFSAGATAHSFRNWVLSAGGDDWKNRVFVANPVSFDKMWVTNLFMEVGGVKDPFHYRTLCLRSMAFGAADSDTDWHSNVLRSNEPTHPHHPLSDAFAQAQDLLKLLGKPDTDPLDEPSYENAPGPFDSPEDFLLTKEEAAGIRDAHLSRGAASVLEHLHDDPDLPTDEEVEAEIGKALLERAEKPPVKNTPTKKAAPKKVANGKA